MTNIAHNLTKHQRFSKINLKKRLTSRRFYHFRQVMNVLLRLANVNTHIFPTYEYLASEAGVDLTTARRAIVYAMRYGFITTKINRKLYGAVRDRAQEQNYSQNKYGQTSNIYVMSAMIYDRSFREMFGDILPALRWTSLVQLWQALTIPFNISFRSQCEQQYKRHVWVKTYRQKGSVMEVEAYKPLGTTSKGRPDSRMEILDVCMQYVTLAGLLTDAVKEAKDYLTLTDAGACLVSAYSERIIGEVLAMMRSTQKPIDDPFKFFISHCEEVSKRRGEIVKHEYAQRLADTAGVNLAGAVFVAHNIRIVPKGAYSHTVTEIILNDKPTNIGYDLDMSRQRFNYGMPIYDRKKEFFSERLARDPHQKERLMNDNTWAKDADTTTIGQKALEHLNTLFADQKNRVFTPEEEELIQWFRDYYRWLQRRTQDMSAYAKIVTMIQEKSHDLYHTLSTMRNLLAANGWHRQKDFTFAKDKEIEPKDEDAPDTE